MKFLPLLFLLLISYCVIPDDASPTTSDLLLTEAKPFRITWKRWQTMLEHQKRTNPGADDSTLRAHPVDSVLRSKLFTGYLFPGNDTTASCLFITIDTAKRHVDTLVLLGKKVTPWPTVYLRQYSEITLDGVINTYDSIKQIGRPLNNSTRQPAYVTTVYKMNTLFRQGKDKSVDRERQAVPAKRQVALHYSYS